MPKAAHTLITSAERRRLPAPSEGDTPTRRSDAPTRRGVLGGAFLLAAGGAVVVRGAAVLPFGARDEAPRWPAEAAGPDAELIALCREHIANHDAYNSSGSVLEPEDDPLWAAYCRTRDAISAAEPQTLAGMVAKARAAKAEAQMPDGEELWESTSAGKWAADLADDLIRLAGRT